MKVLYLSETESLQVREADDLLRYFLKNGAPSALLKRIAKEVDAQGFSIGVHGVFGHFVVINLNLPNYTISIQPKEEEKIAHEGISKLNYPG